jgi:hypothetical protein
MRHLRPAAGEILGGTASVPAAQGAGERTFEVLGTAVAYDPDHPSEAALAIERHGRWPLPGRLVLLLGLLAGLLLAAAVVTFVLGP